MATLQTPMSRAPLLALAGIALASVLAVAWVRPSATPSAPPLPQAQRQAGALQWRTLHFSDTADHGIAIHDAANGRLLDTLHGEQGFVRGVLRALTRERRIRGVSGSAAAFELAVGADGRLTLHDPATGLSLDLLAFGPTNAGAFARLLTI